jgi:hypothetical protein
MPFCSGSGDWFDRVIVFLHPLGTELDRFAVHIAASDRFNPGMKDGKPAVVANGLLQNVKVLKSLD